MLSLILLCSIIVALATQLQQTTIAQTPLLRMQLNAEDFHADGEFFAFSGIDGAKKRTLVVVDKHLKSYRTEIVLQDDRREFFIDRVCVTIKKLIFETQFCCTDSHCRQID